MSQSEYIAAAWRDRLETAGLRRVSELLARGPDELGLTGRWETLTKPGLGGRQRWRWTLAQAGENAFVIYVKRYAHSGLKAHCDRIVRQSAHHSRAWWEFRQAERLAEAYVPTPEAVGVAEQLWGWRERRSVVLLRGVAGDAFDRAWTRAVESDSPLTRGLARHDLAARLGRFISAFHQTGTCHRDLYLCHVFADLDFAGRRPPRFTLIDLARTFRPRLRRTRWIIKDLAQLDSSARQIGASAGDRLRFLQAYLGLQSGSPRLRWYARRIVRKSDWILRRIARKSRTA